MIKSIAETCLERVTRAVVVYGFAVTAMTPATALAQAPNLGSAESFAILAGATVTNTGATNVTGDVGVGPGGSITGNPMTIAAGGSIHEGDAVAAQARLDASETYDELEAMACATNLTGQNLGGQNLSPGVYCFDADAQLTGAPLTLTGAGPWIFQIGGALSAGDDVTVAGSTAACNGSSVFWQVGTTASVGAGTSFVGNILAQTSLSLGVGATLDGRAVAGDAASAVTLDTNAVAACSFGEVVPAHAPIKVTGGGQIALNGPTPASAATYGFNATPAGEGATGHLNYLNHVSGLHVDGTVTDADVVTLNPDGSPKMVRFSGTCLNGPTCTFSVTVEDNGEPPFNDRFGIAVVGSGTDETTADRRIRNGNIQFHLSLTTSLGGRNFRAGDVMAVSVSLTPGTAPPNADAYLVVQLPDGQLMSWTGNGLVPGLAPLARNIRPVNYRAVIARLAIPAGTPAGTYTWFSGLTAPGTMNLVSDIAERRFTITP
ncbi:MAG TPA: ice-binding family protein [Vicinamibacterales bacterium]|nr:ice-binding family protein [Vicinamibacterales bacterium]